MALFTSPQANTSETVRPLQHFVNASISGRQCSRAASRTLQIHQAFETLHIQKPLWRGGQGGSSNSSLANMHYIFGMTTSTSTRRSSSLAGSCIVFMMSTGSAFSLCLVSGMAAI